MCMGSQRSDVRSADVRTKVRLQTNTAPVAWRVDTVEFGRAASSVLIS